MRLASAVRSSSRFAKGFVLAAVLAAACSGDSPVIEFHDEGELCLWANADLGPWSNGVSQTFAAGQAVSVTVAMPGGSSSCSEDAQGSCAVEQIDATTLRVTSQGSYRNTASEHDTCTPDETFILARCSTPPLATGVHSVIMGNEQVQVAVPSTTSNALCVRHGQVCAGNTQVTIAGPEADASTAPHLEATGGCTGVCLMSSPSDLCTTVTVNATGEGLCTIAAQTADGRVFEARVVVEKFPAVLPCTGLNIVQQSPFAPLADAGAPDAAAPDAAAPEAATSDVAAADAAAE